jgi:hypothetical protein
MKRLVVGVLMVFLIIFIDGCYQPSEMFIKDNKGKEHFYNEIVLFNADSTEKWCYTHESFEKVKKIDSYSHMRNRINKNIELQNVLGWRIF